MAGFKRDRFGTVEGFQVFIEEEPDGTFTATSPALPGYVAYGQSESGAIRRLKRAMRRNLAGVAEDYVRASQRDNGTASRHKSRLYFEPPFSLTSKILVASVAVAVVGLLYYELRRRD